MKTNVLVLAFILCFAILLPNSIKAQEFPVTTSTNVSTIGEVGFDGTNYLFAFAEDSMFNLKVQFISNTGALVGNKISLGYSGGAPLIEFDGTNYLVLWSKAKQLFNPDKTLGDTVFGQFINTNGGLVGNRFVVAINSSISSPKGGCFDFNNGLYMVIFKQDDFNYALTITPSGVISSPIQLSSISAGDNAMAFDGTNYLVAWWTHGSGSYNYEQDIYGQLINSTGSLVGGTFIIDDDNTNSDNPLSMAFDGNKFMITFHVQEENGGNWNLYSRFVSTSAVVYSRICLRDSSYSPSFGYTSFDGTNYLVTWADNSFSSQSVIRGRYFNTSGMPIDSMFTIFSSLYRDIPVYAGNFFTNNKYLVVTYRLDTSNFQYGDIYGAFVPSSTASLKPIISNNEKYLIYPNPTKDYLNISTLSFEILKSINIYNVFGKKVLAQSINKDNNIRIDVSNLSEGMYFVELNDGKIKIIKKFILVQ